ncbi:PREDICTED: F-box protein At5g18160-like [Camelina sativa]|uniref:F-box protein At5g18160-like n=1 Tax=Camelina sativa TaxID=90675 RepID=A0ABM0T0D8_CAMSA|nr:PREDICTED: F-box protein At5g18160-like [Camelina sativa]
MEEKTGQTQRTTQSSSSVSSHDDDTSQSEHIPLDLTIEILSRLPAKSVGRFRSLVIWNPKLKRSFVLPEPEDTQKGEYKAGSILGYDQIDAKYIVLRVIGDSKIWILTFGALTQGSCRIVTNGFPKHRHTIGGGCINNGVIYYSALVDVGVGIEKCCIMSFDISSEKFNEIKYPESCSLMNSRMIPYDGTLALDGDRHEWTHKRVVLPLSKMDLIQKKKPGFKGVSNAGETVLEKSCLKELWVMNLDLLRTTSPYIEENGEKHSPLDSVSELGSLLDRLLEYLIGWLIGLSIGLERLNVHPAVGNVERFLSLDNLELRRHHLRL